MSESAAALARLPQFAVPLFCGTVLLARSVKDWNVAMAHFGGETIDVKLAKGYAGVAARFTPDDGNRYYVAGVFDGLIATLAHEIAHVTFAICEDVGVPVRENKSNETFTYLLGHLLNEALPAFGAPTHSRKKT